MKSMWKSLNVIQMVVAVLSLIVLIPVMLVLKAITKPIDFEKEVNDVLDEYLDDICHELKLETRPAIYVTNNINMGMDAMTYIFGAFDTMDLVDSTMRIQGFTQVAESFNENGCIIAFYNIHPKMFFLKKLTRKNILNLLAHELRHYYQRVNNTHDLSQETYIDLDDNFKDYLNQECEKDAYDFGNKYTLKHYPKSNIKTIIG